MNKIYEHKSRERVKKRALGFKLAFFVFFTCFFLLPHTAFANFDPTSISGLKLWLKADAGTYQNNTYNAGAGGIFTTPAVNDGDPVLGWRDYSASGLSDGSVYTGLPTGGVLRLNIQNGLPVVRFTSANLLNSTMPGSVNRSVFAVVASRDVTASQIVFRQNQNGIISFGWSSGNFNHVYLVEDGVVLEALSVSTVANNEFAVWEGKWNSSGNTLYRGGVLENLNADAVSGVDGQITIGGYSVDIGEILIYNAALTDAERLAVQDYLKDKWGTLADEQPGPPATPNILVADGNSLTLGLGQTPYPAQLATSLDASWQVVNDGVGSQTTPGMISTAPLRVDNLYNSGRTKNMVVAWEGTNDITGKVGATAAYNNLKNYSLSRKAYGWKVLIMTILPRSDDYALAAGFESIRQTVNVSIRANWATFADGLVDIGDDPTIGQAGQETNTTYYVGDKVHLNTAGYTIVANAVLGNSLLETSLPTTTDDYASNNVWVNSNQSITLTPTDTGGSGIASTKYCVDTSNTCDPSTGISYSSAVTISNEGTNYFRYESTDNAGNVQVTVSKIIKIDKTAPSVNAGTDATKASLYTQGATASDTTSGIATYAWTKFSGTGNITFGSSGSEDTTVSSDVAGTFVILLTVTDNAGNVATSNFNLVWTTSITHGHRRRGLNYDTYDKPIGPFSLLINNGQAITNNQNVISSINAGSNSARMAVSNDSGFINSGQEPSKYIFLRYLGYGDYGNDVLILQQLLNKSNDTQVASIGVGSSGNETTYFGLLTEKAVQKFQIKHGIVTSGTVQTTGFGSVGPKTRTKLQEVFK